MRSRTRDWATAVSAAWPRASWIRWRRCNSPPWGTASATNTECSARCSATAGSEKQPDNWLQHRDPWEVARPQEKVEVKLNASFEVRGGGLRAIVGKPSVLIGIPYDRPVVGYGGKTINTLRLWAASAVDYFDFQVFSHGEFVGAVAETLEAMSLTRVLYPDDSTSMGQGLRFVQEYFLVACSLADLIRRFRRSGPIGARCRTKSPSR